MQEPLFYKDFRGALCHLVKCLGGAAAVGMMIRPALTAEQAEKWVSDCLNIKRVTKFDYEELVALCAAGRKHGIHCATHQFCDETGYERPDVAPTKTPEQLLAERMAKAAAEYQLCADEMAKLQAANGAGLPADARGRPPRGDLMGSAQRNHITEVGR